MTTGGLLLVAGCAGGLKLSAQWTDPAFRASSLGEVLVLGVDGDPAVARALEGGLVNALGEAGIRALAGTPMLAGAAADGDTLAARVAALGADGVLNARWVDASLMQKNYSGAPTYLAVPAGYDAGWRRFWADAEARAASAGGRGARDPVLLEASLFRAAADRLAWSALTQPVQASESRDESSVRPAADALVASLAPNARRRQR